MSDNAGDLSHFRREYVAQGLTRENLPSDPFQQFALWFEMACEARPDDASSMTLATADANGRPSARIVLLKHFDSNGFAWYTDYQSQKGRELEANPQAEILFYWYGLERQVRIQGKVARLSADQADAYFHMRPEGSQLSAAVSEQSQPVASRDVMEARVVELEKLCSGKGIPRPERWGGYVLIPDRFEFWQGRENRLHDRFCYQLKDKHWQIERLQP